MKIGILTFHRANNLGAVLQASALLQYLQNYHGQTELIDFYPNNAAKRPGTLRKILSAVKRVALFPSMAAQIKKEKRFAAYREKYYTLSGQTLYGDEDIRQAKLSYDVLISGSDQIFNTNLTGDTAAYYLDFENRAKKISYASSFGRSVLTEKEIQLIKEELPKFSAISVRENTAAEQIKREAGLCVPVVVDPVFLLDKAQWSNRCSKAILQGGYIFVYSMENSENLEIAVATMQQSLGLPVIVVRGGGQPGRIFGKEDATCGPEEFLRYIRDAALVITNSFHGTAFSILFEKQFLCVAHSTRNARLANLMQMIDRDDALIVNRCQAAAPQDHIVDGWKAGEKMNMYIEQSKAYLQEQF